MNSEEPRRAAGTQNSDPESDTSWSSPPRENGYGDPNTFATSAEIDGQTAELTGTSAEQATPASPTKAGGRAVREIVETLLLALVIFVGVRLVVLNFRVDGESMLPNLADGEMLLVNRNLYFHFDLNGLIDALPLVERDGENIIYPFHPPERGDIVVFNPPGRSSDKPYIKRVIGLPGEQVTFGGGHVFIDGVQVQEPYIDDTFQCIGSHCDVVVPDGHIYVLGDNRNNSTDSRTFGVVAVDSIIGKAWIGYWPSDEIGIIDHYDYPEISDD